MRTQTKCNKAALPLLWGIVLTALLFQGSCRAENTDGSINITFSGTLSNGACNLSSNSENIEVQFPTVAAKYFSLYDKVPEQRFRIGLEECEIGRDVQVQFKGTTATAPGLEGMLKISGPATQQLGIQLVEYVGGTPHPLTLTSGIANTTHQRLATKVQILEFGAYLRAASAVRTGAMSVTPGGYSAVANFELLYE